MPGRSAKALQFQWSRVAAEPVGAHSSPASKRMPVGVVLGRRFPWRTRTRRPRTARSHRRTWEHHVAHGVTRGRKLTVRQAKLLRLWCLDEPGQDIMLCNLGRAEGQVRRHLERTGTPVRDLNAVLMRTQLSASQRDALGLAYRPGEPCHTVTCSNSNLNWIVGPDGRRGFATCMEMSRFMGYGRSGDIAQLRRMRVCESTVNAWLAESVPTLMAESCALLGVSHVRPSARP